ncbi:galactose oxidase [Mytilinidion resinicola]|uniref:Galactose oxidase n=1 Tax=Mytilinidion resinicola TaxID=574789 RepID=A0A6A6Y436_9PEZI|nr:galactose oxidase [Mytilinidion resinicola]KAF2803601.1 galactose oxidase [Mytilinidion resinicola]
MLASTYSLIFALFSVTVDCSPLPKALVPRLQQLDGETVPDRFAFNDAVPLARTGWTAVADSIQGGDVANRVLDGNANTLWHSEYTPALKALPHTITIDMKKNNWINGFAYLPRQDSSNNGNIGQHTIQVSKDNTNWQQVALGTYGNTKLEKKTLFSSVQARYVRITAYTEAQGTNLAYTSAAEINILSGPDPILPRDTWKVSADSAQAGNAADLAIDGDVDTKWHTPFTGGNLPGYPHTFTIDQGAVTAVSGFSYLPRPDASGPNGRVGKYIIQYTNNTNTWADAASGTWVDDSNPKTVTFPVHWARYWRLRALSEAGNRGPWASAAEINLHDGSSKGVKTPLPASLGQWSETIDFPIVPVAAAVLSNGKVVTWSAQWADSFGGGTGQTQTAIFDPATGKVSQKIVTNTKHDMFCPGISMTADGKVVVTGGNDAAKTSIYTVASDAWASGANMQIKRGYQGQATLSDGRIFTIGGSWSGGYGGQDGTPFKNGEIYSPGANKWTLLPGANVKKILTQDAQGPFRTDNHAWLFGWKGGFAFQAGPSKQMNWFDMRGDGVTTSAGNRGDDNDAMNGNAIMYDAVAGKILTIGGAKDYQETTATANAHIITLGGQGGAVSVTKLTSMKYARSFANSVVLPDGKVLIMGGQHFAKPFSDDTAVLYPELWDPATGKFTVMNPANNPRNYHSVGVLLPDGTVFSGGGGLCGSCTSNHFDAEVFRPPYLFTASGALATRPTITKVSATTVTVGDKIQITTGGTVTSFSLIRMGSATHSINTDQRRIPLTPTKTASGYQITVPGDSGIALPGSWMLFAIQNGVPSVAKTILIKAKPI